MRQLRAHDRESLPVRDQRFRTVPRRRLWHEIILKSLISLIINEMRLLQQVRRFKQ